MNGDPKENQTHSCRLWDHKYAYMLYFAKYKATRCFFIYEKFISRRSNSDQSVVETWEKQSEIY